jgi:protein TIF31
MHQLTQAHFLVGNVKEALACAENAWRVFKLRLGETHGQSVECGKGVELLRGVVERGLLPLPGQGQGQGQGPTQITGENPADSARRLAAAPTPATASTSTSMNARYAGLRSRLTTINGNGTGANGVKVEESKVDTSRIGERGHLEVDELVQFIQGGVGAGKGSGKKNMRGKKRGGK